MKKAFTAILALIFLSGILMAQDQPTSVGFTPSSYYTFSWNTTFTIGDFNKWVGNASPAGFEMGGHYFIKNGLTAGFNISWQRVSQEYGYQTFYGSDPVTGDDNGRAITATNYRFTWMVPFSAVAAYHFMPDKMISPYIGLGIGGDYMEHHLMIQEYDMYKTRWDFSLTPEVGALIKFGNFSSWGALIAGNYKWTTNKIEIAQNWESSNLSMFNLKVGLVLIVR
jgi:opacity protein-like surface antigen